MTTLLAFALVITVLVFVHELGHFLAARWFGVPVEVFSIGFGPRVWSLRRGGVEYRISAIPFGGYVKMGGGSLGSQTSNCQQGAEEGGGFDSKAPWQRFVILLAGPAANIAFALVLAVVALWSGIELPDGRFYQPGALEGMELGARAIGGSSLEILRTLGGLLTGELSLNSLIGPVGLAQIAGESTAIGWRALLAAMAFISLNLGICNLLPIPILDGGHMLMIAVEGITRRDMPVRFRKALVSAGAVAMLLLLVTTFYNDFGRLGWL